jgi:hypothetical protein
LSGFWRLDIRYWILDIRNSRGDAIPFILLQKPIR